MTIKNEHEEKQIKKAAKISTEIVLLMGKKLEVGIRPAELEQYAWELCKDYGVEPSFFNVPGEEGKFKYSCCISVNDEILHGIPSKERPLIDGDLVKVDFGVVMDGFYTDQCFTFIVGKPDKECVKLAKVARLATETAMKKAITGTKAGDLGFTMEGISKAAGYDTLKMFVGHGIGRGLHEYPEIPSFGPAGTGDVLEAGMVICVECQVIIGSGEIYVAEDGWTIRSVDGGSGAMFEYMVIVRDEAPEIITPMQDWDILNPN